MGTEWVVDRVQDPGVENEKKKVKRVSPEPKKEVVIKEYKPEIKTENTNNGESVKKMSRFSGGLEAFKKARAMSPSNLPKVDPDAPLVPEKVEIPGFPKA